MKVWYWAIVERERGDHFVARLHDLPDLIAEGVSENEAIARLKDAANEYVTACMEAGSTRRGQAAYPKSLALSPGRSTEE